MYTLIDQSTIIVSDGGDTVLIAAGDPAYPAVHDYLVNDLGQDIDTIREMVSGFRTVAKAAIAQALDVVDGDTGTASLEPAYRITHGDPVEEVVLATALRLTREQADMAPLARFLQRLERNPSAASRSQLFGWLKAGGFTITTEGMIVCYKSVQRSGLSAHSGREPVTVVRQDGGSETVTGNIPYPVSATVFMPRHLVDDDRQSACSRGLHVGTYSYAEHFSQQMLVVLVDPADVVSVPADHSAQKMRVCRLRVAAIHDGEQISDAVIEAIRTAPDFDAAEEYAARPENKVERPSFSIYDFARIEGWDEDDWDDDDQDDDDWDDDDEVIDLDALDGGERDEQLALPAAPLTPSRRDSAFDDMFPGTANALSALVRKVRGR